MEVAIAASGNGEPSLRIAFYCNLMGYPKRSAGGVRQWVLTMANALVDRGHIVDVLSEAPRGRFIDEPLLDPRVGRVVLGKGLLANIRLHAYVYRHPGVRVVAALDYYNLRAAKLKRWFGDRVNVTLTQREHLSADRAWRSPSKYRRIASGVRRHFNRADAVVTVSHGLADDLRDNFGVAPAKLVPIYNPAFRKGFEQDAEAPVDHPWLASKDKPVVIAAGRLHHVKGFDVLLEAFAQVRRVRDVRLIILGEGKERAALEQKIHALGLDQHAALPGRRGSVAPWMARSDLFVLSSRREGLPAVLIEALAIGLPVVATRCPSGPEEILEDGRWGTMVAVDDAAALAAAMLDVLGGPPPDRAALRRRAAVFSLERALERYLELWRR